MARYTSGMPSARPVECRRARLFDSEQLAFGFDLPGLTCERINSTPRPASLLERWDGLVAPEPSLAQPQSGVVLLGPVRFLLDRAARLWDAGQPARAGDTVSGAISRFHPQTVPPVVWAEIGPLVTTLAEAGAQASPYGAKKLASVLTQLAVWCRERGFVLDAESLLHPNTIEQFVNVGCARLKKGTRANYRSQLRSVGEQVLGGPLYPPRGVPQRTSDPVEPYSADEVAALVGWANGLPTEHMRHNVKVLLALGLGAGLKSEEVKVAVGSDIVSDDDGVVITTCRDPSRLVPVTRRWEDDIRTLADAAGHHPLFRPNRASVQRNDVTHFIDACPRSDAPRLNTHRLRATWVVGHLHTGTPLHVLSEAAGVRPEQLALYARHLPLPDACVTRRLLRG